MRLDLDGFEPPACLLDGEIGALTTDLLERAFGRGVRFVALAGGLEDLGEDDERLTATERVVSNEGELDGLAGELLGFLELALDVQRRGTRDTPTNLRIEVELGGVRPAHLDP